jgi:hypothetical protein
MSAFILLLTLINSFLVQKSSSACRMINCFRITSDAEHARVPNPRKAPKWRKLNGSFWHQLVETLKRNLKYNYFMTIFISQKILLPFSYSIEIIFCFCDAFLVLDQGVLFMEASRSHSETPQSVGILWRVIGPKQKPLPDNTQQLRKQTSLSPTGFEPAILANESRRPTP